LNKKWQALLIVLLVIIIFLSDVYLGSNVLGLFNFLVSIAAFAAAVLIFLDNRQPAKTIAWLMVLVFNPLVGLVFFLLFGQSYRKRKMFAKKAVQDERTLLDFEEKVPLNEEQLGKMGPHQQQLIRLAHRLGKSPVSFHTDTRVLTNGEETFAAIIEELQRARHHIHLEFYIVRDDQLGNRIKDILIAKAREGVEVRFLYDFIGSWKLPRSYIEELKRAGVRIEPFLPVKIPWFSNKVNFRNHRKIIVIDGNIGFVGGLNIGDEYLGKDPHIGFWRDTHLWVKGEAVRSLQLIFLQDWYYMTDEQCLSEAYLSPEPAAGDRLGIVQMVAGGPDSQWEVIKNLFFAMINSANESIWIASPYFIPDEDILTALKVAALSGIDVKLLVPSRPDKRIVYDASRSYFSELLEAGVKIYSYRKGFMHSKIIITDGELASIGTSNMDMRSFHLNFEVNAFLYRTQSVERLVQDFNNDLKESDELLFDEFRRRPLRMRVAESFARLISPLL
jgi:cardiolipin synthase